MRVFRIFTVSLLFTSKNQASTLLDLSLLEGIATYLAYHLDDSVSEADALFWTPEKWQAAEQHQAAIIQAFKQQRDETDAQRLSPFIHLNVPLQNVPGAPDRTAYYVGFLAVRSWVAQNPDRPLVDLLSVPSEEYWQALNVSQAEASHP